MDVIKIHCLEFLKKKHKRYSNNKKQMLEAIANELQSVS